MSESLQIYIHSSNSDSVVDGAHYFKLPLIEVPSQCHIYIGVANATIPISYYNITSSNNTLKYTITGDALIYTVTIPEGNYDVTTLKTYLNSVMTNFTVTYDYTTNKYTFTHSTSNFVFQEYFGATTCFKLLGFPNGESQTSTSRVLTSINCIDISSIKTLSIQTDFLTGNINKISPHTNNILCRLPVDVKPFEILTYTNTTGFKVNLFTNVLNTLMIKICDRDGNAIDFNGVDWSMTLQLDIVDFVE